jgi:hypothetical protein
MKISWGIKIIISFVVFILGIGTMVAISMSKNIDLVSENYYERELRYQEKIDMINRTNSLDEKPVIENKAGTIKLKFPGFFIKENISGKVYFYRAMDKKKDFNVDIKINSEGIQEIPVFNLDKGSWKAEVIWSAKGQNYFIQSDIFLN